MIPIPIFAISQIFFDVNPYRTPSLPSTITANDNLPVQLNLVNWLEGNPNKSSYTHTITRT